MLVDLEKKEAQLKKDLETEVSDKKKEELLKIDDIIAAIQKIKDVPDQSRLEKIVKVLRKMDDDHDGSLKIDDVLKVNFHSTLYTTLTNILAGHRNHRKRKCEAEQQTSG